jgi:hypothetical protein
MCNPKPAKPVTSSRCQGVFSVPTIFEKPIVQMNLDDMDSADVKALKKKDPFMYYSISEVRTAAVRDQELDTACFDAVPTNFSGPPSKKQKQTEGERRKSRIVTRKSCVSYEVHPDLLFLDDLSSLNVSRTSALDSSGFYDLLSMLEQSQKSK